MNIHENARTTPCSRALLVKSVLDEGWRIQEAADAAGISRRTAYKWLRRFRTGGLGDLRDRTSRAHRIGHGVPADWCSIIEYLRGFRQTARSIAQQLGMARSTVSAVLARRGLGPQAALEPPIRPGATSVATQGNCCTWISRSSPASGDRDTASQATVRANAWAPAGNSCISRSTTSPASPMQRSSLMKRARPARPSCDEPAPGSPVKALSSRGCSLTTARGIDPTGSVMPAKLLTFGTNALARTHREPTARQSASSSRCCANGPMVGPTAAAPSAPRTCRGGFATTMRNDNMPASITSPPSADGRPLVNNGRRNHT